MKNNKPSYYFETCISLRFKATGIKWVIKTPDGKTMVVGWSRGSIEQVEHVLKKAIFRFNRLAGYTSKPWNESATELREHDKKDPSLKGSTLERKHETRRPVK